MQRSVQMKYLLISIKIHVYNEAMSWISPWKHWDLESFFPSWPRVSQGSMSLHRFAGRIGQEGTWFLLDVCHRCGFLTAVCSLMWRWQFGACMCVFLVHVAVTFLAIESSRIRVASVWNSAFLSLVWKCVADYVSERKSLKHTAWINIGVDRTNFPGFTSNGICCYKNPFLHMMEKKQALIGQNVEWLSQNTKIKSQNLALSSQNLDLSSQNNEINSLKLKVCVSLV